LLHIADVVAQEITSSGISAVGLLGTRFVMEQEFYSARFRAQGIDVVLPNKASRNYVDNVIYNELCAGKLIGDSRDTLRAIIIDLQHSGAEAVVLACTELPLLINANEVSVRLFDTMALHAHRAVTEAITDF
jgi:aspartate racemase